MATQSSRPSETIAQKRSIKLVKVYKENNIGYNYVVTKDDVEITQRAPFLDAYFDYYDRAGLN